MRTNETFTSDSSGAWNCVTGTVATLTAVQLHAIDVGRNDTSVERRSIKFTCSSSCRSPTDRLSTDDDATRFISSTTATYIKRSISDEMQESMRAGNQEQDDRRRRAMRECRARAAPTAHRRCQLRHKHKSRTPVDHKKCWFERRNERFILYARPGCSCEASQLTTSFGDASNTTRAVLRNGRSV
jgi:hypothetical protein